MPPVVGDVFVAFSGSNGAFFVQEEEMKKGNFSQTTKVFRLLAKQPISSLEIRIQTSLRDLTIISVLEDLIFHFLLMDASAEVL